MRFLVLIALLLCACISAASRPPTTIPESMPTFALSYDSAKSIGIAIYSDSSPPADRTVTLELSDQYFEIQKQCQAEISLAVIRPEEEQIAIGITDIAPKINWGTDRNVELLLYDGWLLRLIIELHSECEGLAVGRYHLTEAVNNTDRD